MKYRQQSSASSGFSEARLDANTRQHVLKNLKVFTVYEVKVAAVNDKGTGPYTPLYSATTGEKRKPNVWIVLSFSWYASSCVFRVSIMVYFCMQIPGIDWCLGSDFVQTVLQFYCVFARQNVGKSVIVL